MATTAAPNESTWDTTPSHRPGLTDFEGAELEDDGGEPPVPGEFPTAALINTICKTMISLGKVVPSAILSCAAGGALVQAIFADNVTVNGDITVTLNAAGDVSLTWPANRFPPAVALPVAALNIPGGLLASHAYGISVVPITNGVRVTTLLDAALASLPFTVSIY